MKFDVFGQIDKRTDPNGEPCTMLHLSAEEAMSEARQRRLDYFAAAALTGILHGAIRADWFVKDIDEPRGSVETKAAWHLANLMLDNEPKD